MSLKGISGKETVYVDTDDEITAIIDKVASSKQDIVALVLPKRSAVLQSVVNMRLLKRAADENSKKLVLITGDSAVLPLAGLTGLHVAKNLQSKPEIPPEPGGSAGDSSEELTVVEETPTKADNEADDQTETIELDDEEAVPIAAATAVKAKKNRKLKVPNFERFRLGMVLAIVAGVGLIIFLYLAIFVLPKATVTITTDSTSVKGTLVARTTDKTTELNEKDQILPSSLKELKQNDSAKVPATGQKDIGNKASGEVTVTNCSANVVNLPAGTTFTTGGLNYVSQAAVSVPKSSYSLTVDGFVCDNNGTADVDLMSAEPGDKYNIGANKTFSISVSTTNVSAKNNTAFTGGTSQIAKVVSDGDVEKAKQQIADKNTNVQNDFYKKLEAEGLFVLQETATTSEPKVTATPAVGSEANEANVSQEVTYAVLTVKRADLEKLLRNELNKQIDTSKQELSEDDLLKGAIVRVSDKTSPTEVTVNVEKAATAIPILDQEEIKQAVAGKKSGEIQNILGQRPGIKEVSTKMSPFWVSKAPKDTSKITIVIVSPTEQ